MDTDYDTSRLERLKRGLYDKDGRGLTDDKRAELSPSQVNVGNDWEDTEIITEHVARKKSKWEKNILRGMVMLAIFSALGSGAYLLYQYFDPLGKPSDKNIVITFDTPVGVSPGVPADIAVHIVNHNRVALEYANIALLYPLGTRVGDNPDKDLNDEKKVLGVVQPGEEVVYRTKAVFLGEENEEKEVRALLNYRFEGINSVFTKENTRAMRMLASPLNMSVNMTKEVNAGQELNIAVNVVSNTTIALRDVFVRIDYPQGFTYEGAEPKPTFGNNIWRVGRLEPSGKFAIKLNGVMGGEDTQQKVFHTTVGVGSDKTERDIAAVYGKVSSELTVSRPFIGISLAINGKPAGDAIAQIGQTIGGVVNWRNNLSTQITNAEIEVKLKGIALDRPSVLPDDGGFYRSWDDTIIWEHTGNPTLKTIEAGETGSVSFSFRPLPAVTGTQLLTNVMLTAEVTVRGKRLSDENVPEEINVVMAQNVRISSEAQFAARSVYYVGPFVNSGPIPPRIEQETTYTVIWNIVNTSNTITGTRVTAVLPVYVKWYGSVSPSQEKLSFNESTSEVTWDAGDVMTGTGISRPPREVAFQVVLQPSLTQAGLTVSLVNNMMMRAVDSFTNKEITRSIGLVSTALPTDPKAKPEQYIVVK